MKSFIVAVVFLLAIPLCVHAQIQPPPVDDGAANRGEQLFSTTCAQCHGADARGTANGPDLLRALPVLHDRVQQLHGAELAPLLEKQPNHAFHLTQDQVADLSQFLTRAVNRILRSGGYYNQPSDLLSGDAKAGEAYFNGAGGCTKCHSVTGDLAGIGGKYPPATLQQKIVFPQTGFGFGGRGRGGAAAESRTRSEVTVTLPNGSSFKGDLVRIDDFDVTLQDLTGAYKTFARTRGTKVDVTDPYAAHVALLDKYTDADIHNLTAYLETLK